MLRIACALLISLVASGCGSSGPDCAKLRSLMGPSGRNGIDLQLAVQDALKSGRSVDVASRIDELATYRASAIVHEAFCR